jgi:hypothetical protein
MNKVLVVLFCFTSLIYASGIRDTLDVQKSAATTPSGLVRFYPTESTAFSTPRAVIGWDNLKGLSAFDALSYAQVPQYLIYSIKFSLPNLIARPSTNTPRLGGMITGLMDGGVDERNLLNNPTWIPMPFTADGDNTSAGLYEIPASLKSLSSLYAVNKGFSPEIVYDAVNFGQFYVLYAYSIRNIYQFNDSGKRGTSKLTFGNGSSSPVYLQGQGAANNINSLKIAASAYINAEVAPNQEYLKIATNGVYGSSYKNVDIVSPKLNFHNHSSTALLGLNSSNTVYLKTDNTILAEQKTGSKINSIVISPNGIIMTGTFFSSSKQNYSIFNYNASEEKLTIGADFVPVANTMPAKIEMNYANASNDPSSTDVNFYGGDKITFDAVNGYNGSGKQFNNIGAAALPSLAITPLQDGGVMTNITELLSAGALNANQLPYFNSSVGERPISITYDPVRSSASYRPIYNITYNAATTNIVASTTGPILVGMVELIAGDSKLNGEANNIQRGWRKFGVENTIGQKVASGDIVVNWPLYGASFQAPLRVRIVKVSANSTYINNIAPASVLLTIPKYANGSINIEKTLLYKGVAIKTAGGKPIGNFRVTIQACVDDINYLNTLRNTAMTADNADDDIYNCAFDTAYCFKNGLITLFENVINMGTYFKGNDTVYYVTRKIQFNFKMDDIRPLITTNVNVKLAFGTKKQPVTTNGWPYIKCEYYLPNGSNIDTLPLSGDPYAFVVLPTVERTYAFAIATRLVYSIYYVP